jgi:hypothetical protein
VKLSIKAATEAFESFSHYRSNYTDIIQPQQYRYGADPPHTEEFDQLFNYA